MVYFFKNNKLRTLIIRAQVVVQQRSACLLLCLKIPQTVYAQVHNYYAVSRSFYHITLSRGTNFQYHNMFAASIDVISMLHKQVGRKRSIMTNSCELLVATNSPKNFKICPFLGGGGGHHFCHLGCREFVFGQGSVKHCQRTKFDLVLVTELTLQ